MPVCPRSIISMVSRLKEEKVVKPPSRPTASSRRIGSPDGALKRASHPASSPIAKPPTTFAPNVPQGQERSEEHTSELQSLMRNSYAVFCLKKQQTNRTNSN